MICPLLTIARTVASVPESEPLKCICGKDECAWYNKTHERCAILVMSFTDRERNYWEE